MKELNVLYLYIMFEKELEIYKKNLTTWIEEGRGIKFVLIKGENVDGFYDTYDLALTAGYEKYKSPPFFVKQIAAIENVQFISRIIQPACLT